MIIEAGYDLMELLHPEVFKDEASRRGLWVLAMDEDLRLSFIRKVRDDVPSSLDAVIPDLVTSLDCEPLQVRYFVLAHMVPHTEHGIADEVQAQDELINDSPALVEYEFLGRFVFDGEYVYSSAPRYRFRDYIGYEHLPRTATFPGPHEFITCSCMACRQYEAKLARNRERHEAAALAEGGDS
ncbi:hypothetical protein [Glaciibacter superstes]|uniref:hypothetical protein n=1 Tax=Glaciibacter superstes TaxID=501023 RepID=UPI0003B3384B|nr:hypothetical protein [Glaciibacter superstes]